MNPLRAPEKGEVLKLGLPASGEVIITVDPASAGTTFAAGTQTFLSGAEMPVHKHLDWDVVLFVSKGQGRVTLNERIINVVPGAMLHVPRGAWCGVRNTGTGTFQIAWVSAPPGLEAFFRDLSRLGASPSAHVLQELAQRHRIEFRQATDASMPAGRRRRERRGGRRGRGGRGPARPSSSGSPAMPSSAPMEPASTPSIAPAASSAPHGHRRRRRRRVGGRQPSGLRHSLAGKDSPGSVAGRRSAPPAAAQGRREDAGGAPPVSASAPLLPGSSRPGTGHQRSAQRHRPRRVKEVYMDGRWVRVEGEGPVIATGPQRPERRNPKRGGDDEPPPIRLSVPL